MKSSCHALIAAICALVKVALSRSLQSSLSWILLPMAMDTILSCSKIVPSQTQPAYRRASSLSLISGAGVMSRSLRFGFRAGNKFQSLSTGIRFGYLTIRKDWGSHLRCYLPKQRKRIYRQPVDCINHHGQAVGVHWHSIPWISRITIIIRYFSSELMKGESLWAVHSVMFKA